MKYWLYRDMNILGPYEMEELAGFPGFNEDSLICPESHHGKLAADWHKAGKIQEMVEAIVERSKMRAAFIGVHKSLEETRERVEKDLEAHAQETKARNESLSQANAKLVDLDRKLELAQSNADVANATLQEKIDALESTLREEQARRDQALEARDDESVKTLQKKIDALESTLKEEQARRDQALEARDDERVQLLQEKIDALESTLKEEQARRDQALQARDDASVKTLQNRMGAESTALREKIDALKSQLSEVQAVRDQALEARYDGGVNTIQKRMESLIGSLQEKIASLENLRQKEADKRDAASQIRLSEGRAALQKEMTSLIESLSKQVEFFHDKVTGPLAASFALKLEILKRSVDTLDQPKAAPAKEKDLSHPRPTRILAGMGAVIAAALVLGFWFRPGPKPVPEPVEVRTFQLPHDNPTAIVWRGDRLWTADWMTGMVYEFEISDGALKTLRRTLLPAQRVTGLALSEKYLFLANATGKRIEQRLLDDNLTLVNSAPSPGPAPSALFWDGRYLWSADLWTRKIYKHAPNEDFSILTANPAPASFPSALYKDEDYFWSADAETRLLYQHQLNDSLTVLDAFGHVRIEKGDTSLSGFSWRNNALWLARDGDSKLLVIDREALDPRL